MANLDALPEGVMHEIELLEKAARKSKKALKKAKSAHPKLEKQVAEVRRSLREGAKLCDNKSEENSGVQDNDTAENIQQEGISLAAESPVSSEPLGQDVTEQRDVPEQEEQTLPTTKRAVKSNKKKPKLRGNRVMPTGDELRRILGLIP